MCWVENVVVFNRNNRGGHFENRSALRQKPFLAHPLQNLVRRLLLPLIRQVVNPKLFNSNILWQKSPDAYQRKAIALGVDKYLQARKCQALGSINSLDTLRCPTGSRVESSLTRKSGGYVVLLTNTLDLH